MKTTLEHLIDPILQAAAQQTPLCIRGSGSKDFYGEPPLAGSPPAQLLDTRSHSGIVSYEPTELVVTVRAGTPLAELEAALAEQGQCLAFEPPHFAASDGSHRHHGGTCGGMVAAGLSGPARASAGGLRDYLLGVQLLNGRGEHLTFGGQVMKNVAGYDVSRLLAGSLGTLGVLTELSLKVLPAAPAEATLVFELDQPRALAQLHRWGGQPLPLNASCWLRDDTSPGTPELLFVRLRGAVAAVDSAVQKMTRELPGQCLDNAQAKPDWQACRDQRLPFFATPPASQEAEPLALWRLSLPQTAPALDLPWPQLVEWQGGQRWLWAPLEAQVQLRQVAAKANGFATLYRADSADSTRARGRFHPINETLQGIHRRLKAEFDPARLFNRGRMYPDL